MNCGENLLAPRELNHLIHTVEIDQVPLVPDTGVSRVVVPPSEGSFRGLRILVVAYKNAVVSHQNLAIFGDPDVTPFKGHAHGFIADIAIFVEGYRSASVDP